METTQEKKNDFASSFVKGRCCGCQKPWEDRSVLKKCERCTLATYCNETCLVSDLEKHKKTCGKKKNRGSKVFKCNYCSVLGELHTDLISCHCGLEFYCSYKCQRADWKDHQEFCLEFKKNHKSGDTIYLGKYFLTIKK